jgi:hypothetical protein
MSTTISSGAGDPGVVHEVVDPAEAGERLVDRADERRLVGDVDVREDVHPVRRAQVAERLDLGDDRLAHRLQLRGAARGEHHARPGDGQQAADLPADPLDPPVMSATFPTCRPVRLSIQPKVARAAPVASAIDAGR